MSTKRATIGRTFSNQPLSNADPDILEQVFTLSSGRRVVFTLKTIPANEVEAKTFVVQAINGRDQNALTPESLKDITRTLKLQQFFPCIGIQRDNGIEILDGSRRRSAAILCHTELKILVTVSPMSADEARKLAADIQTAKEHNIREIGMRLLAIKQTGMTQKEIAELEGLSQAKVTRALQAASVSAELISLFPVQSELTFSDYKVLCAVEEQLKYEGIAIEDLIMNIAPEVDIMSLHNLPEDEVKNKIIKLINKEYSLLTSSGKKEKSVISVLHKFNDKDRFARKKVRGRMFSYEFNRLSKEVQDELDRVISETLRKHLN
ncbi:ParB family protein [Enterobacter ludwigii]|uniref:ParB family protein n=1 Tax=Enterobacter ludwigii TaxID=299767 RepID=UPI003974CE6C